MILILNPQEKFWGKKIVNVVIRSFERIYNNTEFESYMKNEDLPENKEIIVYGFKHVKTDKVDKYIIIGCESDELNENNTLSNLWSNEFLNKEIEMRNFKLTGWSFLTLVTRNNFLIFKAYVSNWIQ